LVSTIRALPDFCLGYYRGDPNDIRLERTGYHGAIGGETFPTPLVRIAADDLFARVLSDRVAFVPFSQGRIADYPNEQGQTAGGEMILQPCQPLVHNPLAA